MVEKVLSDEELLLKSPGVNMIDMDKEFEFKITPKIN